MDVVFDAGSFYQPQPLTATTAIKMLGEGTSRHASAEIAEHFDFYGASVEFRSGIHTSEASLLAMNKFAGETIQMFAELIGESVFPEKEMKIFLRNRLQQFKVKEQKTSWLARRELQRQLFGSSHPYGNMAVEADFERLQSDTVRQFYAQRISNGGCRVYLSGRIDDTILTIVRRCFSFLNRSAEMPPVPAFQFTPAHPGKVHVEKSDAVQTSIRVGKKGVSMGEEDYACFLLLNTVIGGYFGSRLMSNVREEKGYTYGIHSINVPLPLSSCWEVCTDVDNKYTEDTIREILKEVERVRREPVPEDELRMVKSFFYGALLREIDGVFAQSESLRQKAACGTDLGIYGKIIDKVRQCTPADLQELALRYLNPDEFHLITVGKSV